MKILLAKQVIIPDEFIVKLDLPMSIYTGAVHTALQKQYHRI